MFDTSQALEDMANQVRACRSADGLTLQQLASRSGVAASTIHKVEAQQMIPTVAVLLKISKGLGRRPQDLIRDSPGDLPGASELSNESDHPGENPARDPAIPAPIHSVGDVGVWQINLGPEKMLPTLDLHPHQRAILLVQKGGLDLQAGDHRLQMDTGDCIEVEGKRIESRAAQPETASLLLIVSPPGNFDQHLGEPTSRALSLS